MKNFRKVLALILVVATLFSFVAMASAKTADEYKDYADVKYTEAVDVLTAIGITEGYDGAYHPADTIGRDEVAAMIARLRNGGDIDAKLYTGADKVFADVKGQWSEGYVTYCAQLGVIAGRNATTFDPTGKVTGTEVLKMLLCVLGFDASENGYVGANWQVNVVRDAKKAGLLIDGVDVYAAATRDEVAQYFLNALQARVVIGYLSDNVIDVTNSIWVDLTDFPKSMLSIIKTVTPDAVVSTELGSFEIAYCNAIISGTYLWESVDGLRLTNEDTADCFGRPAHKWTVNNKTVGVYTATPVATYTAGVDASVDYAKDTSKDPYWGVYHYLTVYHNGEKESEDVDLDDVDTLSGNGVLTEFYLVDEITRSGITVTTTTELRVVVIDTFMSKVDSVNKRHSWVKLHNGEELDNTELGAKKGDVIMYTVCSGSCGADCDVDEYSCKINQVNHNGYVHSASIVTPVTVEVDETHRVTNTPAASYIVTEDGKTYEYSWNSGSWITAEDDADARDNAYMGYTAAGTTKLLYLDSYGYIQLWTDPAADDSYEVAYFVENTNTKQSTGKEVNGVPETYYYADIVDMEANGPKTLEDADAGIYETMATRYGIKYNNVTSKLGTLMAYAKNANGLYDVYNEKVAEIAPIGAYINSTKGELVKSNGTDTLTHFNADTQYLIRKYDFDKGEYAYEAATGYKDVENYVGKVVTERVNAAGETVRVALPTIQYLDMNNDGISDYLFVDAFYKKTTSDCFYVLKAAENVATKALQKFFPAFDVYEAVVNGEVAYVVYYAQNKDDAAIKNMTLYRSTMQAVNAEYKGMPIYVALSEANDLLLGKDDNGDNTFDAIYVKDGQIKLVKDGVTVDYIQSSYNADLSVIIVAGNDGAKDELEAQAVVMNGTEFAEKFDSVEWLIGDVYAVRDGSGVITTLYIELNDDLPVGEP